MPLEVGSVIPFQFQVKDSNGNLINPSTISVTITRPDGTTTLNSPTNPPAVTGIFPVDHTSTMTGLYYAVATTTGPTDVSPPQSFYVSSPETDTTLVSLADFKTHMRITSTGDDELLRTKLVAATSLLERESKLRWRRTVVTAETHDGGELAVSLWKLPVQSITTVVESGITLSASDYVANFPAGMLYRGSTQAPRAWLWGLQNVIVTYVAGPEGNIADADVRDSVMEAGRYLWQAQRGASAIPSQGGDFEQLTPEGVPFRLIMYWRNLSARGST